MIVVVAFVEFVALVVSLVIGGAILAQLWAWFIVPKFNLPALSVPEALGIALLISLFVPTSETENPTTDTLFKTLFKSVFRLFTALVLGWIIFRLTQ